MKVSEIINSDIKDLSMSERGVYFTLLLIQNEKGFITTTELSFEINKLNYHIRDKMYIYFKISKDKCTFNWYKAKKTISDRIEDFRLKVEIEALGLNIDKNSLKEFIDYWTEHSEKSTKFRMELQRTFEIKKRLERWIKSTKQTNQVIIKKEISSR